MKISNVIPRTQVVAWITGKTAFCILILISGLVIIPMASYVTNRQKLLEESIFDVDRKTPLPELIIRFDGTAMQRGEIGLSSIFIGKSDEKISRLSLLPIKKADIRLSSSSSKRHAFLDEVLSWINSRTCDSCRKLGIHNIAVLGTTQVRDGTNLVAALEFLPDGTNRIKFYPPESLPDNTYVAIAEK